MRSRILVVVLAACLITALGCSAFAATSAKKFDQQAALDKTWKAPDSTVVGTISGVKITKGELIKYMWYNQAPTALQDMLSQKMIEQAAAKAKVSVTPAEIQKKIQESLQQMQMGSVDQLLQQYKITKDRFMAGNKISLLAEKTARMGMKVSDAEYAEYIKARHILIRFPAEEKDQAKKEEIAKKKIDEIYAKVKANPADFAKLADEYSEDPGNSPPDGPKRGGLLDWFNKGRMVAEFEKAAFAMKPGEISEPVKTFYGYHIIKLEAVGKDASPAEKTELKKQIVERKLMQAMQEWYQNLQATSKMDNKLMWPEQTQPTPAAPPAPKTAPSAKPQPKPTTPPPSDKPDVPPPPPPAN